MQLFLRLMASLALVANIIETSASPDTQPKSPLRRVPAQKPPPPGGYHGPLPVELKFNSAPHDRLPGKKPPPPGGRPGQQSSGSKPVLDGTMCGLDTPTAKNWKENQADIAKWFKTQYNDYLQDYKYQNIALFLRDRWAPKAVSSGLFCDSIGACSIASCLNLIDDDGTNQHDRQMALYVFEQIAGIDHLFDLVDEVVNRAISDVLHRSNRFVDEFSSAPRIKNALKDELKREQIGMAIASALGLVVAGGAGFLPDSQAATRASTVMIVNTYIGIVTTLNAFRENPDFVHDLKDAFKEDLAKVLFEARNSIVLDLHDIMIGAKDTQNRTIVDYMTTEDFLEPDPELFNKVGDHIGRVVLGAGIMEMWKFDRAYFVLVDMPAGCEKDKTEFVRGPIEYLVCLPELPKFGFWFYSIDRYHEYDGFFKNSHANTRGPTGFFRLKDPDPKYFDLTLQDVARSSYWVHQNNLIKKKYQRIQFDPKGIDITLRRPDENLGKVPGVFTVPICYNPGGESISGVMDEKGQNYPCMCGNFGWNNGWWSIEKDETLKFLAQSGLMFSEDFEAWCSNKNKCKGANDIDWHSQLEAMRKPNDPPIPKHLKHPFKKCKKRRDSQKHPGWPGEDMAPEHKKRNEMKWARYDEQGRNTSTDIFDLEP